MFLRQNAFIKFIIIFNILLSYNIYVLRVKAFIKFPKILKSFQTVLFDTDIGLTGTTSPGRIEASCNGNKGGTRGVLVIVVGNGHGDTSSNP